jgi:hypothetical protein
MLFFIDLLIYHLDSMFFLHFSISSRNIGKTTISRLSQGYSPSVAVGYFFVGMTARDPATPGPAKDCPAADHFA